MQTAAKVFIPAAVVVIGSAAFLGYQQYNQPVDTSSLTPVGIATATPTPAIATTASPTPVPAPVAALGTPDDVANSVLQESGQSDLAPDAADPTLSDGSENTAVTTFDSNANVSTNEL